LGRLYFKSKFAFRKHLKYILIKMNSKTYIILFAITVLILVNTFFILKNNAPQISDDKCTISELKYIGHYNISNSLTIQNKLVGGFSGIDFSNNKWVIISDDKIAPIRFYTANLDYDGFEFKNVSILSMVEILNSQNSSFQSETTDPESIRFDPESNKLIWTSEGNINKGIDPSVNEITSSGEFSRSFDVPNLFKADTTNMNQGPRQNGTFEGLSLSIDKSGYWVSTELPLIQDGVVPIFENDTESPIRISLIDKNTGSFGRQFVYELEKVSRKGAFCVNGVTEILEYEKNNFLVIERSYAGGGTNNGFDIKIFNVNSSEATDVSNLHSLEGQDYKKATKKLILDLKDIIHPFQPNTKELTRVDNVEGISFGPKLANGNRSLVLVVDNNFSSNGKQNNQFIAFEVIP
jgi:hypothetical protein